MLHLPALPPSSCNSLPMWSVIDSLQTGASAVHFLTHLPFLCDVPTRPSKKRSPVHSPAPNLVLGLDVVLFSHMSVTNSGVGMDMCQFWTQAPWSLVHLNLLFWTLSSNLWRSPGYDVFLPAATKANRTVLCASDTVEPLVPEAP